MLETLLEHSFFLNRHREAPLLKEREVFLEHLQQQGTSRAALRNLSGELIHVVCLLRLEKLREVGPEEIHSAAQRWSYQQRSNPKAHSYGNTTSFFIYAAKKWLRFHGCLKMPSAPAMRFANQLGEFARYMTEEQGLSPHSVRSHCWKTSKFLAWFGERHRLLVRVSVEDVDEFLAMKGAAGWNRKSVSVAAQAVRAFFRYAETRGWCAAGFAKGIQAPRIYQYEDLPEGPTEKEVRQLVQSVKGSGQAALRTRAILMLFAVYGLRSGEVSRLQLRDFDWRQEVFVVNHSKGGGSQRYPLQREVGDAILHYLKEARPRCACRHLFVTLHPPYRSVGTSTLWLVTSSRIKAAGLRLRRTGPHSLRHACATRLLLQGVSFKEIGDVLGHRGLESVGIYAKVDLNALRVVANVNLGGLL
jgi:site-specific recombinase XerD